MTLKVLWCSKGMKTSDLLIMFPSSSSPSSAVKATGYKLTSRSSAHLFSVDLKCCCHDLPGITFS